MDDFQKPRLNDEEAKETIRKVVEEVPIHEIQKLPKDKRNELIKKIKEIEGISQRQAARILGVSQSMILKA